MKSFTSDKYTISGSRNCPPPAPSTTTQASTPTSDAITTMSTNSTLKFEQFKDLTININNGNQTSYTCKIGININLLKGFKFEVIYVSCEPDQNSTLAVNSEIGIYRFMLDLENDITTGCQFAGVFIHSKKKVSKTSIEESIQCNSYCKTIGGPDPNVSCKFPFIWKGREYGECTDIDNPSSTSSDLFCATDVYKDTNMMKSGKWGTCSRSCGYCYGSDTGNLKKKILQRGQKPHHKGKP